MASKKKASSAPLIRYAAFLRGISPMNAKMPDLKAAFEKAGFSDVKTVLASGNVVFSAEETSPDALEHAAEAAMQKHLGRSFLTIVRPMSALHALLEADPFAAFDVPPNAKRVVTFLRDTPKQKLSFPVEFENARILGRKGREVFTAYVPGPTPVFMTLIEKTFGTDLTTRTWDTIKKVAAK